jgi:hypothetical protein
VDSDRVLDAVEEHLTSRSIGEARVTGEFADICGADWISELRAPLESVLAECRYSFLDASVLVQAEHRSITQLASQYIRASGFDGIYYRSRHGLEVDNWAIFEPWRITDHSTPQPLSITDPDVMLALKYLGIL